VAKSSLEFTSLNPYCIIYRQWVPSLFWPSPVAEQNQVKPEMS